MRFTPQRVTSDMFDARSRSSGFYETEFELPVAPDVFWAELHQERPQRWFSLARSTRWVSERRDCTGATREVTMAPGAAVHEEFFVWEKPDARTGRGQAAFSVTSATVPGIRRLGERITVSAAPGGCRVRWEFVVAVAAPAIMTRAAMPFIVGRLVRDTRAHFDQLNTPT